MTAQSIEAVASPSVDPVHPTAHLVVGCPGGRVQVITPGPMRTGTSPHGLGGIATSDDLGYGGCALAARMEAGGSIRIWFGTVEAPCARPQFYGALQNAGALADSEVSTGAVHEMTFNPANGQFTAVGMVTFYPTILEPRGANGVVGLKLVNLLFTGGEQLVVCTLSGDIFLLDAATRVELWRTHVNGAVGFHNSILAEDIDNDGRKELYIGGSAGLWRFKQ
jgi:hypothetical protein